MDVMDVMDINAGFLVCVRCMTYNQSVYITDALNGFCMQKTAFPYYVVVFDDASTDGEQNIIKDYLYENFNCSEAHGYKQWEREEAYYVFVQHRENTNCHFLVVYLKKNLYKTTRKDDLVNEWCKAKYIALCEGDDYWTDPLKLQGQVDFMEEHPDYSLCCHRYKIFNQNDGTWEDDYVKRLFEDFPAGFSFGNKENLDTWITKTMTVMYKRVCYDSSKLAKYKYCCDEHLNYHLLLKGRGYCLPFVGAVYRRCHGSVFSSLSEIEKIKRWFRIKGELLKFNLTDRDLRDRVYYNIKQYLYNHQTIYREMVYSVPVVLKSFYKTESLGKTLVAAKKIIGSYARGLKKSV